MKSISEVINEQLITEAAAKDLRAPRKGSTIYAVRSTDMEKGGDIKLVALHVSAINYKKDEYRDTMFDDNELGIESYFQHIFKTIKYDSPLLATEISYYHNDTRQSEMFILGVSKDAIKEFVNQRGTNKLNGLNKQIAKLEAELNDLQEQKAKVENAMNAQISESFS